MGGNGKNGLTHHQKQFMYALERIIKKTKAPASVSDLRGELQKSDGRIRSHLKRLIPAGYVCCIGKVRSHQYVPSILWTSTYGNGRELPLMGGYCQAPGCEEFAVQYFRGKYWCRDHMMNCDDAKDIRAQHIKRLARKSCAADLLECTY